MPARRIYYALKPYLPWSFRMGARRVLARRKLANYQSVWPINESSSRAPLGWPGWPEGRQFSFIITHDVEGPEGVAKCRQMAELEMEHGFRSSFNFIPKGTYEVSAELRNWLTDNGFEIGVHDYHHDGSLYRSRRDFFEKVPGINKYLAEWGAVGFRAGFMFHNLEWLHSLNTQYDASTFDVDPFEPQNDGVNTIFPFWVPPPANSNRPGYVELPYSLAQDSTAFLLFRHQTPEIWTNKLDWVAKHGGMALVNVHPDYLRFPGEKPKGSTFDVANYAKLLAHVRDAHKGKYWHTLPKTLAAWYKESAYPCIQKAAKSGRIAGDDRPAPEPPVVLRGKRVAVILFSDYPDDVRVRRAAEAMVQSGMEVDLLCLQNANPAPENEWIDGVQVFRLPMMHTRGSKFNYIRNYAKFFFSAFWFLTSRSRKRPYDVVHVHNMPDALVFTAIYAKMRGAKLMLDLHDPMPELMTTIFGMSERSFLTVLLKWIEKWSIWYSDISITPNIAFKTLFVSRSCKPEKMDIVMNTPEHEIFDPTKPANARTTSRSDGVYRIMHHGLIAHRHGVDLLVEAVALVRAKIPGVRLDLYGPRTAFLDTVLETAQKKGVADIVHFHGSKSPAEIAQLLANADLGVIPNRRSAFTELNFPTRIFEYLAMHRPVITPATQGICDYFGEGDMLFFEAGNAQNLADKILWVHDHPAETDAIVTRGEAVYRKHMWAEEKSHFLSLTGQLLSSEAGRK
jgi:glycosyltransferase involved in cell wall biosynthesis